MADVSKAIPLFVTAPLYRHWHLRWGATAEEIAGPMPGDELVPVSHFTATRAITVEADPELVWPWLVQVGFRRAGFYTYDLLDSLGKPSADKILPEWQHPRIGDVAAPMTGEATPSTSFRVASARRPDYLVWSKPDSTWAWHLTRLPLGRTRLVTRLKQHYRPMLASQAMTRRLFHDMQGVKKGLRTPQHVDFVRKDLKIPDSLKAPPWCGEISPLASACFPTRTS